MEPSEDKEGPVPVAQSPGVESAAGSTPDLLRRINAIYAEEATRREMLAVAKVLAWIAAVLLILAIVLAVKF